MSLILADTSVWVAHFRRANPLLQSLVAMDQVFTAMANAAQRAQELVLLSKPNAVATVIKQLPAAPSRSASA